MYIGNREFFLENILHTNPIRLELALINKSQSYHTFQIPKNSGWRTIQGIQNDSALYGLQKALCKNFLDKIPLPAPAAGFVREESYLTFLKPHTGKTYYLRLDIQNFFDSVTTDMLKAGFSEFFSDSAPENLTDFISLCTYDDRLPQGAVTSPAVSNVVFRRTDQRILKYCQSFDFLYRDGKRLPEEICYTRYADDMLFSSRNLDFSKASYFTGMISRILQDAGFRLNRDKVKSGRGEISLSGFVVSENIHLSRQKLHSLNELLHFLGKTEKYESKKYRVRKAFFREPDWLEQINRLGLEQGRGGTAYFRRKSQFLDYLCGYRSFLLSVIKANGSTDGSMQQLRKKVWKLEQVIDCVLGDGS